MKINKNFPKFIQMSDTFKKTSSAWFNQETLKIYSFNVDIIDNELVLTDLPPQCNP